MRWNIFGKAKRTEKAPRSPKGVVDVMVIPHGGASARSALIHFGVFAFLLAGGLAVLAFAGFMVADLSQSVISLTHLKTYERSDAVEAKKLEALERGLAELEAMSEEVTGQHRGLVKGYRLDEVRPTEALLPPRPADATTLEGIERRVAALNRNLRIVNARFTSGAVAVETVPSIMPCRGWFWRDFGNTVSPFTGRLEMHRGLDIVAPRGTPIVATAAGVVTASGLEEHWGLTVEIDHGNGFVTRYAHNLRNVVTPGTRVKRGQVIAYVGSTGRSTCTHVHYEVLKDGVPVNPRLFILREPPLRVTRTAVSKSPY